MTLKKITASSIQYVSKNGLKDLPTIITIVDTIQYPGHFIFQHFLHAQKSTVISNKHALLFGTYIVEKYKEYMSKYINSNTIEAINILSSNISEIQKICNLYIDNDRIIIYQDISQLLINNTFNEIITFIHSQPISWILFLHIHSDTIPIYTCLNKDIMMNTIDIVTTPPPYISLQQMLQQLRTLSILFSETTQPQEGTLADITAIIMYKPFNLTSQKIHGNFLCTDIPKPYILNESSKSKDFNDDTVSNDLILEDFISTLPFNIKMTDQQRKSRNLVELPYMHQGQPSLLQFSRYKKTPLIPQKGINDDDDD